MPHTLQIYQDKDEEIILLRIEQDKPPEWLEKTKQRGMSFSYHDEKVISIKDIKIESSK